MPRNPNGSFGGEPVVAFGALAAAVVFILANFDVVIEASTVEAIFVAAFTLISTLARAFVTPVK